MPSIDIPDVTPPQASASNSDPLKNEREHAYEYWQEAVLKGMKKMSSDPEYQALIEQSLS